MYTVTYSDTERFLDGVLEEIRVYFPALLLFILLLADTAVTAVSSKLGNAEANPVFAHFTLFGVTPMDWFARMSLASAAAILFALSERALVKKEKLTNRVLVQVISIIGWWVVFLEALVVLWNLLQLL